MYLIATDGILPFLGGRDRGINRLPVEVLAPARFDSPKRRYRDFRPQPGGVNG